MAEIEINTSALRAKTIYDRLMGLTRPDGLSNNEWAKRAGVNTSFFTNLRNGSQPSVENLRRVLKVVGVTLPEFFVDDAAGRVIPFPTKENLQNAILAVLPGLPRNPDKRAEYLAEAVSAVLALPESHHPNLISVDFHNRDGSQKDGKAHESNTSSGSALPRTG